ncbi:hypothetical protein AKO1_009698 [Acrasis kona]|uniref:Lipid droplet-associated hydrolase n=1 Tax=Acrasis kona TaxID=1008807 RepID=A0AAW2ZMT1_9EUKA
MAQVWQVSVWDFFWIIGLILIVSRLFRKKPTGVITTSKNKHLFTTVVGEVITEYIQRTSDNSLEPVLKQNDSTYEDILVIFPGNPGIVDIYDHFVETLSKDFKTNSYCIIAVGLAGHTLNHTIRNLGHVYNLEQQIQSRINIIKHIRNLYPKARISLAGHSVGGYLCLQMLSRCDVHIHKVFMLYATIQNMYQTKNAVMYDGIFKNGIRQVLVGFAHLISILVPSFILDFIVNIARSDDDVSKPFLSKFLNYNTLSNVIHLAMSEFEQIRELSERDINILKQRRKDIYYIFGRDDGWVPLTHVDALDKLIEHDQDAKKQHFVVGLQHNTRHAFVIFKKDVDVVSKFITDRM